MYTIVVVLVIDMKLWFKILLLSWFPVSCLCYIALSEFYFSLFSIGCDNNQVCKKLTVNILTNAKGLKTSCDLHSLGKIMLYALSILVATTPLYCYNVSLTMNAL